MYIFILFIIILLIILVFLLIYKKYSIYPNKNIESFSSSGLKINEESDENRALCSNFYKNAFCQFDIKNNKNMCKYQKDNVKIAFDSPDFCCNNGLGCINNESSSKNSLFKLDYLGNDENIIDYNNNLINNDIEKDNSDTTSKNTETSYYCNIGGKCKQYNGTILNSHISTNNCGTDVLNNQLLLPYASYEECSKSMNPCDKYNNPEWSQAKIKTECLKNINCGICKNESGIGKCVEGTATEPLDLQRYFNCGPKNYEYGNHTEYII
jgi:hypothetical protein